MLLEVRTSIVNKKLKKKGRKIKQKGDPEDILLI